MRYLIVIVSFITGCQPTGMSEPPETSRNRFSAMSCAQLLRVRGTMERETIFFVSTHNEIEPVGAIRRAAVSPLGSDAEDHKHGEAELKRLLGLYRTLNGEISSRGCSD